MDEQRALVGEVPVAPVEVRLVLDIRESGEFEMRSRARVCVRIRDPITAEKGLQSPEELDRKRLRSLELAGLAEQPDDCFEVGAGEPCHTLNDKPNGDEKQYAERRIDTRRANANPPVGLREDG